MDAGGNMTFVIAWNANNDICYLGMFQHVWYYDVRVKWYGNASCLRERDIDLEISTNMRR